MKALKYLLVVIDPLSKRGRVFSKNSGCFLLYAQHLHT